MEFLPLHTATPPLPHYLGLVRAPPQLIKDLPSIQLRNPPGSIQLSNQGDAFVDDSYLAAVSSDPAHPEESAIANLQSLSQTWERGPFTTGGAINLQKSFWVLMAWRWKGGQAFLVPPSLCHHSLELTAGYETSAPITVPQMSPYESYRTLGAYISPSGGMHKVFQVLRTYSLDYATRFQSSSLTCEATLWSYLLYLLPKLHFPLMAMTFTEAQCAQIQSPALCALLPRLYLNQNMACSIIHGPILYRGMNLPHCFTSQGVHQLKFLTGHLWAQDKTCRLILISHGFLQLLLGISENFLNTSYKQCNYLACPTWFTSLWHFMSKLHLSIEMKQVWLPNATEGNDINLMDYFLSFNFTPKQLQGIHFCRVYLQLLSLADMVSTDGCSIIEPVLQGCKLIDRRSKLSWPTQENPSTADWTIWLTAFQSLATGSTLHRPLDMSRGSSHQTWFWFIDKNLWLYQWLEDSSWRQITPLSRNTR